MSELDVRHTMDDPLRESRGCFYPIFWSSLIMLALGYWLVFA